MVIDRSKTQVSSTIGTYRKVLDFLTKDAEKFHNKTARVLDYGAGLCEGTKVLSEGNFMVESYEPFPKDGVNPTHRFRETIKGKFTYIVSNCVLNVIEDIDERKAVVKTMLNRLEVGGVAIIMVRSHSAIKGNKTNKPYSDGFINAKGTFQRGFTTKELLALVKDASLGVARQHQPLEYSFLAEKIKLGDIGVIVARFA